MDNNKFIVRLFPTIEELSQKIEDGEASQEEIRTYVELLEMVDRHDFRECILQALIENKVLF